MGSGLMSAHSWKEMTAYDQAIEEVKLVILIHYSDWTYLELFYQLAPDL